MPIAGDCPYNRMVHHLLQIMIEIVIHADLQEGQQPEADLSHKLPALFINNLFDLFKIVLEGILVL